MEYNINKGDTVLLRTPIFVMSFPNLVDPDRFKENGKPKGDPRYGVDMIMDAESGIKGWFRKDRNAGTWGPVDDIRGLMVEVAKVEFGADFNVKASVEHGGMHWPLRSGDKKAAELEARKKNGAMYVGKHLLRIQSNEQYPPVLTIMEDGPDGRQYRDLERDVAADMAIAKRRFRGGHFAVATCVIRAGEVQSKYLTFYVNSVLFAKEGQIIGGLTEPEDRFGGIVGGESDHDPTAGMDGANEIPA